MKLPPLREPLRYTGLFIYDFGDRVSVGYTAGEVAVLRGSAAHADGTAYLVVRASEDGSLDLRGVDPDQLLVREAFVCLRDTAGAATADFDWLRKAAQASPVPAPVELLLARVYALDPPHAVALLYPQPCAGPVYSWLARTGFDGGPSARCDRATSAAVESPEAVRIATELLPGLLDYRDRPEQEVLAAVGYAVQR